MRLVDSCSQIIMEMLKKQKIEKFPRPDVDIETFEDRFLLSLINLYDLSKFKDDQK